MEIIHRAKIVLVIQRYKILHLHHVAQTIMDIIKMGWLSSYVILEQTMVELPILVG